MTAHLTFLGAAREVTGSCYLFETEHGRFLVDCGLFQGRGAREANAAPWRFAPDSIDFVLLSHAHLDHSGLLPRLVRAGFRGPVFATPPTVDLLGVMLPDSAHLQEHDARQPGRRASAAPLYDHDDVARTLSLLRAVDYDAPFAPARDVRVVLRDAGHILGSAISELVLGAGPRALRVVLSGDLGQPGRPIVRDPTRIEAADVLLVESTYGDREHKPLGATLDELVRAVNHALHDKQGIVLVPAFAVGRTQELLYWFERLSADGRLHDLRVFVDSPLATEVTAITARHFEVFDEEARRLARHAPLGRGRVTLRFTPDLADSHALSRLEAGAIIIAGSGMCEGGRIGQHLLQHIGNRRTTVLFTGFQAQGTLGRRIVEGARQVTLYGQRVAVRAEIVTLGGFSAHAGQAALMQWLGGFTRAPRQTYVVHGEERCAEALAARARGELGMQVAVPRLGERVVLAA